MELVFLLCLCSKQQILQLDLSYSWASGVKWSPSGNTLAYVGQNILKHLRCVPLQSTEIIQLDDFYNTLSHFLCVCNLCIGHSSMIYFVDDVGPSPLAQSVAFRDLPLRDVGQHPRLFYIQEPGLLRVLCLELIYYLGTFCFQVLFISEKMVIGVGYDSNPMVFAAEMSAYLSPLLSCLRTSDT